MEIGFLLMIVIIAGLVTLWFFNLVNLMEELQKDEDILNQKILGSMDLSIDCPKLIFHCLINDM